MREREETPAPAAAERRQGSPWAPIILKELVGAGVTHVTYVPDAGHSRLIELLQLAQGITTTALTTEEEGVAIAAGAWLGGERSVLLMQSSGVGNCVNMLSLISACRIPFLAIVAMRGEWAEFNPWQIPMGQATENALRIIGVRTIRVSHLDELAETISAATVMAFESEQAIAVVISQRLIGRKAWTAQGGAL